MAKQRRHHVKRAVIEDELRLIIGAGDDVANGSQCSRLHFDFLVRKQRHEILDDAALDHKLKIRANRVGLRCNENSWRARRLSYQVLQAAGAHYSKTLSSQNAFQPPAYLNLIVATVGEVGKRPDGVDEDARVLVVDERGERRQQRLYDRLAWRRIFAAAQVDHNPSDIAQKIERNFRIDESKQWFNDAELNAIIAEMRTVA